MTGKGKGGKKHRRGKNISSDNNAVIPDEQQYFAYVTKILGSGRVSLDYYIPKFNDKTNLFLVSLHISLHYILKRLAKIAVRTMSISLAKRLIYLDRFVISKKTFII